MCYHVPKPRECVSTRVLNRLKVPIIHKGELEGSLHFKPLLIIKKKKILCAVNYKTFVI